MKTSLYNGYKVNLIETLDDIEEFKKHLHSNILVGVDTETHGLTYAPKQIVGYCFSTGENYSPNSYQGYYFPIRHLFGNNLDENLIQELAQYILDNYKTVFWNRPFDAFQMEQDGIKIPFIGKTSDAQIMAHLAFSESYPALKSYAKKLLKFNVIEFEDNNAKNHDFGTTDPAVSFIYAGSDPLITVLLIRKLWNDYPYIRKIYPLDNEAGEAVRLLSRCEFWLDYDVIKKEMDKEHRHIAELRAKIFSLCGYEFKLDSSRDKGDALNRVVTLTKKTKGGQFAVDAETLKEIDHPLAKMLVEYAETKKYLSSYLEKMYSWKDVKVPLRANYSAANALSGRLSSGGAKGNEYFQNLNMQNIPKTEFKGYVFKGGPIGYYLSQEPQSVVSGETVISFKGKDTPVRLLPDLATKCVDKIKTVTLVFSDREITLAEGSDVQVRVGDKLEWRKVEDLKEGDDIISYEEIRSN